MWPFLVIFASFGLPALSAVYRPPSCTASEFACSDGCVSLDRLCDGARDCADGSDERACEHASSNSDLNDLILHRFKRQSGCRMDQFRCKDGTCIGFDGKCDGVVDCPDGSDETHALCRKMPCQSNLFRCTYGACVDGTAPCNGVYECADKSDELTPRCRNEVRESNGQFTCASGAMIPATDLCDGVANCADASDETLSACAGVRCAYAHLFQCAYGACVDAGADCDNKQDCYDGSDEADELCNWNSTTTTTQSSLCKLPSYPANGKYNVFNDPSAIPGNLRKSAILTVYCNQGYMLTGSQYVECQDGVWKSEMTRCVRFCRLNPHQSVTYYCDNEECGPRVLANTIVTPVCRKPNYYSNAIDVNMRCLDTGSFDRVTTCNPGTGITNITMTVNGVAIHISGTDFTVTYAAGNRDVFVATPAQAIPVAPVVPLVPAVPHAPDIPVVVECQKPVESVDNNVPLKVPVYIYPTPLEASTQPVLTDYQIVTPVTPDNYDYNEIISDKDSKISEEFWRR